MSSIVNKELEIEIDLDSLSDEAFDIERSIKEAKEIVDEFVQENRWIKGDFEDDYWEIGRLDVEENIRSCNFSTFDSFLFNDLLPRKFKDIVKCWIVNLLEKYQHAPFYSLESLVKTYEITKGFRRNELKTLQHYIEYSDLSNKYKHRLINCTLNFFEYTDLDIGENYVPTLMELKNKIPNDANIRQLPPSRYVLSFSYYLEKDFEKLLKNFIKNDEPINELLKIYPLIIWWKFTSLIPLRPTEFCLIERNCLITENGKHYIKLPRRKQKNIHKIQIVDKILIDNEMYQLIQNYIDFTEEFGRTDTLISYRSIAYASSVGRIRKKNLHQFNRHVLSGLIEYFYKKMKTQYKCVIAKEHQVLTNDTRHFAFISLMMQGYSPIEIARLGGHQSIQAQYLYSGHKEYWVDCEVFKLMKKVKNNSIAPSQTGIIPDEVKLKVFDDSGNFKRKMKIGFCKDEEQRCESKYCYFCSHWGITPEEFIENKEKIKLDITDIKNNILELTSVIQNLNKQLLKNELSRRNPELLTNIKAKSNKIQSDLYKLALLSSKLGIRGIRR